MIYYKTPYYFQVTIMGGDKTPPLQFTVSFDKPVLLQDEHLARRREIGSCERVKINAAGNRFS